MKDRIGYLIQALLLAVFAIAAIGFILTIVKIKTA